MTLGLLLWMAALMPQPVHEQACLAATVYLEARDQSKLGQAAVAEVVLRRRDDDRLETVRARTNVGRSLPAADRAGCRPRCPASSCRCRP